jgi:hypothetical protein
MIKKITLAVLAVMFVFVFSSNAIAQKGSTDKEAEAIKAEKTEVKQDVVPLSEKMKNPEKYNPTPQTVQTKVSNNPTNKRTITQEIKDLKVVINRLETKEDKLPFEEKRLTQLKQQLTEKEKILKD